MATSGEECGYSSDFNELIVCKGCDADCAPLAGWYGFCEGCIALGNDKPLEPTPAKHLSTEPPRVECDGCYTLCKPYGPDPNGDLWGLCGWFHCNAPVPERKRPAIVKEAPDQGPPAKRALGEEAALPGGAKKRANTQ